MSFFKSHVAGIDPMLFGIVFDEDPAGGGEPGGGDPAGGGSGEPGGEPGGGDPPGGSGDPGGEPGGDPGSGGADTSWRDTVAEDLRPIADRFNSPADAIKAVADLRKQVSTSIRVPGKDAKPEEIAKYHKALGVPDSPGGYEFKMPEGREATDADLAFQGKLREVFHKANIPASAASALNDMWNEMTTEAEEAQRAADAQFVQETEQALQKKWGKDFERNKNLANRAAAYLLSDSFESAQGIELKDGRFLLDHPIIMEAFAKAGAEMDEDGFYRSDPEAAESLKEEHATLTQQIADAQAKGDSRTAQKLSEKRSEISARLYGTKQL